MPAESPKDEKLKVRPGMSSNADALEKLIYPPAIGIKDENVLCPPTDVPSYMQWLRDNRKALRAFWYGVK